MIKDKNKEFELMRSGKLYNATDRTIFMRHLRALIACERYNKVSILNAPRRTRMIKRLIPDHGKNFFILSNFHCEYGCNISFGDDFFANFDCTLLDVAPITLGNGVMLGTRVTLATPVHPMHWDERKQQQYPTGYHDLEYAKPITIGNDVWLSSCVTVCGGVTIGDGAVIGAGSVVTRDIPAHTFAAGVPARVIREITDEDKIDVWQTYLNEQLPLSKRKKTENKEQ